MFFSIGPQLPEIVETVQNYFLSSNHGKNNFTDPSTIVECINLLDGFVDTAPQTGYDACFYVDLCDEVRILKILANSYKVRSAAASFDDTNMSFVAPETLSLKNFPPSQPLLRS